VARIFVLAGPNGAGKSSIAGATFRASGADYFNPDEAARRIRDANPAVAQRDANAAAWLEGRRLLERAIAERGDFAFETTLGGQTITALLHDAIAANIEVYVWYAALASPELHIARVRARVVTGGHDIPERDIRKRYDTSRLNLIELLPGLTAVRVYDNSDDAAPTTGGVPEPQLLLHMEEQRIRHHARLESAPDWVKPILVSAFELDPPRRRR
jgi:predicted ABC-type ATPase